MVSENDMSRKCDDCLNLKFVREMMVGGESSGGPENFFECTKGCNMFGLCEERITADDD